MNRREFLQYTGVGSAGVALGTLINPLLSESGSSPTAFVPLAGIDADFINISRSGTKLKGLVLVDTLGRALARGGSNTPHSDLIQIVPLADFRHSMYAGAMIEDITIEDCILESRFGMQGITLFDGCIRNLTLIRNKVTTTSQHAITLNGVLSAKIIQNVTTPDIVLNPLKIGGSQGVWITSFSVDGAVDYGKLDYDGKIIDKRRVKYPSGTSLRNFNYENFINYAKTLKVSNLKSEDAAKAFASASLRFGEVIK